MLLSDMFERAVILLVTSPSPTPSPHVAQSPAVVSAGQLGFWDRFFTSAGFGGLMAFLAASIAAWLAYVQFRHVKRQQEGDRWWSTLTWVYDRSIVDEGDRKPLPQRVTFAMLTVLSSQVTGPRQDRLRGETISSILGMFQPELPAAADEMDGPGDLLPAEHADDLGRSADALPKPVSEVETLELHERGRLPEPRRIRVEDAAAARLLNSLSSDLANRGFGGMAADFEAEVRAALARITGIAITRPATHRGSYTPDLELHAPDVYVMFEVRHVFEPLSAAEVRRWALSVRASPNFAKISGALLISSTRLSDEAASFLESQSSYPPIRAIEWMTYWGDGHLAIALRHLGVPLGPRYRYLG